MYTSYNLQTYFRKLKFEFDFFFNVCSKQSKHLNYIKLLLLIGGGMIFILRSSFSAIFGKIQHRVSKYSNGS